MDPLQSLLQTRPPASAPPVAASAAAKANPAAMRKTAEDFESFFLSQTFESLYSGMSADPVFGGGSGENVYRSMMLQEYGKAAARSGGVGIADAVYREMMRLQETK